MKLDNICQVAAKNVGDVFEMQCIHAYWCLNRMEACIRYSN